MQIQPHLPQLRTLLRIPEQPPHSPPLSLQPYFRPQTLQPPIFSKLAPTSGVSQLLSPVARTRSWGSFSSTPCTLLDASAPLQKDASASKVSCVQLYDPIPSRLLCRWGFSSKNTRVGCHFLLQGNLPDPGIEPCLLCLLHWQADSLR